MFGSSSTSFGGQGPSFPTSQHSMSGMSMPQSSSGLASPSNVSGIGVGLVPMAPVGGGGSPIYQGSAAHKFPAGGGPVVFSPMGHGQTPGSIASATPASPYSFPGGTASSYVQSPSVVMAGGGIGALSPPPYSSTMIASPHGQQVTSPITHGYGQPLQYSNMQPYGYGSRNIGGGYVYQHHQNPYQQQHQNPVNYNVGHHSPRGEDMEPMHCSPVGQLQHPGGLQYQQLHRNPHSPPRAQYMPAFLTGVDSVALVQPRSRRMFERSPSTSPPVVGAGVGAVGRSPSKSPPVWPQPDGCQAGGAGFSNPTDAMMNAGGVGMYGKRAQGQGPSRQLRFIDSHTLLNSHTEEDKEKTKKSGPPIRGFGSTEDALSFLKSPLLQENNVVVPGATIAQEAILRAGSKSTQIAESNWITVFGFPPAAASFIYTHFAQYGNILQSKCNPGGNWLHIQYSSVLDARKALACNGKVLGGTIMVGVISSPREIIEAYEKLQHSQSGLEPSTSGQPGSSGSGQHSFAKSPLQERNIDRSTTNEVGKARGGIRSLTTGQTHLTSPVLGGGGNRSSLSSNSNMNRSTLSPTSGNENIPLPTSSTGIFTKAMEYMFGW